ncbi:unnamed protein product, partial [Prorocentrum cordatum]
VEIDGPTSAPRLLWSDLSLERPGFDRRELARLAAAAVVEERPAWSLGPLGEQQGAPGALRVATWNCGALVHHELPGIHSRVGYINDHLHTGTILALQEAHGSPSSLREVQRRILARGRWFNSFCSGGRSAGGLATFSPATAGYTTCVPLEFCPGRLLRVEARHQRGDRTHRIIHGNVHSFEIPPGTLAKAQKQMKQDTADCQLSPGLCVTFVAGDFNSALRGATEMVPMAPTHWTEEAKTATDIDEIFVAQPAWPSCRTAQQMQADGEPQELHLAKISDHALVTLSWAHRREWHNPAGQPAPIPASILNHPKFAEYFEQWFAQRVGRLVRDWRLRNDAGGKYSTAMLWRQAARVAWRHDVRLGRLLVRDCPWRGQFLEIREAHRSVVFLQRAEFQRLHDLARRREAHSLIAAGRAEEQEHQLCSLARGARRHQLRGRRKRAQIWRAIQPQRLLAGAVLDGEVHRSDQVRELAFASYCGDVFFDQGAPPVSPQKQRLIERYLSAHCVKHFDWECCGEPVIQDFFHVLKRMKAIGLPLYADSNGAIGAFPPKGVKDADGDEGAIRAPAVTRPLALRNTSMKDEADETSPVTVRTLSDLATPCFLIAFAPSRPTGPVTFATQAKGPQAGRGALRPLRPWAFSFDFKQAFPSAMHGRLWAVMRKWGVPLGLLSVMQMQYLATYVVAAAGCVLFARRCGVLQGGPASGSAFAMAADPFATDMHAQGKSFWCIDDSAAGLLDQDGILVLRRAFKAAETLAGPVLNLAMCQAVPPWRAPSDDSFEEARLWPATVVEACMSSEFGSV